jgi:hypothetical protein
VGVGVWARRDVTRTLARERIVSTPDARPPSAPVTGPGSARSLANIIRERTLAAAGGSTYAETAAYLDSDGEPTNDASLALVDDRTGAPLENPAHALWIQSTALQTALLQAYLAFRLAALTVALGAALVAVGAGVTAAGASRR